MYRLCLVVDDEAPIRTYLRTVLETEQIRCVEAQDACEALRTVHRLKGQLDLVISDVRMPGDMNGIDLAHSLHFAYPKIPVLLLSGSTEEEPAARAIARQFLTKPVSVQTILQAVHEIFPPEIDLG